MPELSNLRHTCAHLLAASVLELYPDAKPTIGPSTENGFYYDFEFKNPISEQDLKKIEKKMKKILPTWKEVSSREVTEDEAKKIFKDNPYKLELIDEIAKKGEKITLYKMGNFEDLCRGGHIDNPSKELKAFKLLSLAGAYWRGDENNQMLTRIYGTAFTTEDELNEHLKMIEEAATRDHRKLGRELDLFTFSDMVGPGLPLWTPKGTLLRNLLDDFVQELRREKGYEKVEIPHLTKKELYQTSGHWDKFKDELFRIQTREGHEFAMKPMNCPHHTQIFARKNHSYKEMPQRYANTTMCYRDEQTGELFGLSRVRAFTQDDAHVFCREQQVKAEILAIWDIVEKFYKGVGFEKLEIRLSLHDPDHPEKYLGDKKIWEKTENELRSIAKEKGTSFTEAVGEAAFYGPKIDFMSRDSLGREWQVATIQIDRNMPERFDLTCINENGEKERVIMLHAAIMGSIERFLAILIEHHAGQFPLWLAPTQIAVLPISEKVADYAKEVKEKIASAGIRVTLDDANETLGSKIRNSTLQKIPLLCIIGENEKKKWVDTGNFSVSIRDRVGTNKQDVDLDNLLDEVQSQIKNK